MVYRNYSKDDSRERKETAGYIGMMVLSVTIAGIDSMTRGDMVSFGGASGIAMLSAWGLMNVRRDRKESAFDEKG